MDIKIVTTNHAVRFEPLIILLELEKLSAEKLVFIFRPTFLDLGILKKKLSCNGLGRRRGWHAAYSTRILCANRRRVIE